MWMTSLPLSVLDRTVGEEPAYVQLSPDIHHLSACARELLPLFWIIDEHVCSDKSKTLGNVPRHHGDHYYAIRMTRQDQQLSYLPSCQTIIVMSGIALEFNGKTHLKKSTYASRSTAHTGRLQFQVGTHFIGRGRVVSDTTTPQRFSSVQCRQ